MSLAPQISSWLLQASTLPDTIVTMPVRSWYDYTNGTLQLIVLVLAVVVLATMAFVLLTIKKVVESGKGVIDKLYEDTKPIIAQATQISADAREVVAMLRTDVERITHAAGAVSKQLLDVATSMENRLDEVSAVIDVVQEELEETALTATAALRGARLGGRAIAGGLSKALMGAVNKTPNGSRRDARGDDEQDGDVRAARRTRERESDRPRRSRSRDGDQDRERRYRENG